MYKSCCLGCGPRARGHADAYQHVRKARLEAVCDANAERLAKFADEFRIPRRYADVREMLEKEKPDLLHVVTQPEQRLEFFQLAEALRVPAVLVEKPLCLDAADFNAIAAFGQTAKTKVIVNHQLRYHPKTLELLDIVRSGEIGEVRLIDGSARLPLAGQGTHVLNLMFAYASDHRPARVFGQASGKRFWIPHHPCPDSAVGELVFDHGVHGLLACGDNAPTVHDPNVSWMHKRVAVYGTQGFVHWTMNSWEVFTPQRGYQRGEKSYAAEDVLGQAAMTDAVFAWLEDGQRPHHNRLEVSLAESNTVLGLYHSALEHAIVPLPWAPSYGLIDALRARL
ncbi:MAG TPA: Gfo/Idh/MocA family oxidoreductase [Planctomycetota bacterium]|nr:Gfo/Idh/MocA family oxidoreductase [Planctomycetota bacterium]HRR81865.1 Gfo/Idh/MocA family oxidoreductase [Planctomycetota bacterium]